MVATQFEQQDGCDTFATCFLSILRFKHGLNYSQLRDVSNDGILFPWKIRFLYFVYSEHPLSAEGCYRNMGLEKYKKSSGKELFTNIAWRDSKNQCFRAIIVFTNYGMFFSILFYVVGLVFKKVF